MSFVIHDTIDLRHLVWSQTASSIGTAGMLLKSVEGTTFYKLAAYNMQDGFYGHEPVNELIVSRILEELRVPHVDYDLVNVLIRHNGCEYTCWASRSETFLKEGERKIQADLLYQLERVNNETPLQFFLRKGWADYIYTMFIVDYLVLNRDRHGANVEMLYCGDRQRIAPLFDHGLSLLAMTEDSSDKIAAFDHTKIDRANNFVGFISLLQNVLSIPKSEWPSLHPLTLASYEYAVLELETVVSTDYRNAVKQILEERWDELEHIRNS